MVGLESVKKLLDYLMGQRRWMGMAMVLGGCGLMLVHFIDFGFTLHFPVTGIIFDNGAFGLLLVIIGAFLGLGKPGTSAK